MRAALRMIACAAAVAAVAISPPLQAKGEKKRGVLTGVVNLNTATASQLDLLPGVGAKAAERIIAHRARQPFRRIEDLVKVKGFGKKRFDKMRAYLAVTGNTTLQLKKPPR